MALGTHRGGKYRLFSGCKLNFFRKKIIVLEKFSLLHQGKGGVFCMAKRGKYR
jgi:hypothetical protein